MSFLELLNKHIEKLSVEGSLATGHIDTDEKFYEFRDALKLAGFSFTTRSSRKENCTVEVVDDSGDVTKKRKVPGRGSLMYKSSSDVSVPFFGYPFMVETTVYYTCSQGIKYYGSKKYPDEMFREGDPLAKKRRRPKVTQKIGCQARMTVKKIKVFNGTDYFVNKDNWRDKKAAIDLLKNDLEMNNKIDSYNRYCVVLSLDTVHNHEPTDKTVHRPKRPALDPAKRVIKLHEHIQEALGLLSSELLTKCTNIVTLTNCCKSLKQVINQVKDSIERADGIDPVLIQCAIAKMKPVANNVRRASVNKARKSTEVVKVELASEEEVVEAEDQSNQKFTEAVELPTVLDGTPVIWDPVNVSWIQEQGLVVQQDTGTGQKRINQPILLQRRVDDPANIGVISQGGQNYTIVQNGNISNLGVSVPLTMAKVVPQGTILTPGIKKTSKRNDLSGVTIAIPAGMEWNQQNWSQMVVSSDQFSNVPSQTVWNIA